LRLNNLNSLYLANNILSNLNGISGGLLPALTNLTVSNVTLSYFNNNFTALEVLAINNLNTSGFTVNLSSTDTPALT